MRWYGEVLGWELVAGPLDVSTADPRLASQLREVFNVAEIDFRQAHMMAGPVALELFEFVSARPRAGRKSPALRAGYTHICMTQRDVSSLARRIVAAGGRQDTEVQPIFPGHRFRFCYCSDPFGNIVEIASHPHADIFAGRQGY